MLLSQQKSLEEILRSLEGETKVFLLGCGGCAESSGTGGKAQVLEMKGKLEEAGKKITGHTVVDFLCQKALVQSRLRGKVKEVKEAESLLVMTCGVGVQAVAAVTEKPVHPACNTIPLGGSRGEWKGTERCRECGDCVLDSTGGICPLTACSKFLLNGACGGTTKEGKCEVDQEMECGWKLIYERLERLGRLDQLRQVHEPKDHSKMIPPKGLRLSDRWALEQGR
ncbi:MAG: methylenetetrahydrofolate reductase C-terminal domain-containing protein [Syntrophaceae bacterium]|jgi:ferredoxin|nr:methylenetetrahydrofolate reductase C-terminal domain-containing protein [Syntrophaceae bacterium]